MCIKQTDSVLLEQTGAKKRPLHPQQGQDGSAAHLVQAQSCQGPTMRFVEALKGLVAKGYGSNPKYNFSEGFTLPGGNKWEALLKPDKKHVVGELFH